MLHFKKILRAPAALLLCIVLLSFNSVTFAEGIAVGGRVGTLGVGGEIIVGVLPTLNGRLGIHKFKYSYDGTESDVDYDIDLNLDSWNALLDWYVLNAFHLTGGFLSNNNTLDVSANLKPEESYTIGDVEFSSNQIGTLTGSLDFENTAWYLGIGWGNPVEKNSRLSINFDLGVVFQGSPRTTLSATGGILSDNDIFKENLKKEESDLENEIDAFKYYPVLSLGIALRF